MEQIAKERDERIKYALAEMKVLIRVNRTGMIKKLKASAFKELIYKELDEINAAKEDEIFIQNEEIQTKELAVMKDQLTQNNLRIEKIEQLLIKFLEDEIEETDARTARRHESSMPQTLYEEMSPSIYL